MFQQLVPHGIDLKLILKEVRSHPQLLFNLIEIRSGSKENWRFHLGSRRGESSTPHDLSAFIVGLPNFVSTDQPQPQGVQHHKAKSRRTHSQQPSTNSIPFAATRRLFPSAGV